MWHALRAHIARAMTCSGSTRGQRRSPLRSATRSLARSASKRFRVRARLRACTCTRVRTQPRMRLRVVVRAYGSMRVRPALSRGRDCLAAATSHVRVLMRLLTRDSCARIQFPRQWARATPCAHRQLSCARALCARVAGSAAASPPASRLSPDGRGLPALRPRARVGSGSLPACLVLQNRAWSMGECACAGRAGCACERTPRGARRAC